MAAEITREMREAVEASRGGPIDVVDSQTQKQFVLLPAEAYAKLRAAMDEGTRFALREMGRRAGWDDPSMDVYDQLDPRQS
ncbi:MAG: hypothetical protein KF708_22655 [Pirellulales bacterium]|nr:hypothetical protein [Pirellulales bacterium]